MARASLDALTGVRAFAAAWVAVYHFRKELVLLFPDTAPLMPLFDVGFAGVDVFFVLSGFIIAYTYLDELQRFDFGVVRRFLWLRLARMYPVHLALLGVFFFLEVPGRPSQLTAGKLLGQLVRPDLYEQIALVHAWGWWGNRAWNFPAWSISVEWFAYLCFPLAAPLFGRVVRRPMLVALIVAAFAFNIVVYGLLDRAGLAGDVLMLRIVGEFTAGVALFMLWRSKWGVALRPKLAILGLFGGVLLAAATHRRGTEWAAVLSAPLFGIGIFGLAEQGGRLARLFASRAAVYAGEVSYALYMTHALTRRLIEVVAPAPEHVHDSFVVRAGIVLGGTVLVVVVSIATYELVEKPARRLLRSFGQPRSQ